MLKKVSGPFRAGVYRGAAIICLLSPGLLNSGLLPPSALDSVVAIGSRDAAGTHWVGSGFLYADNPTQKLPDGWTANAIFLVTNKHVLKGIETAVIRFNSPGAPPTQEYVVPLRNKDGAFNWTGHKDANVDIAILPFEIPDEVRKRIGGIINPIFRQLQSADRAKLRDLGVTEGDHLFVLGFPVSLFADPSLAKDLFPAGQNVVFVRQGIVARIRDTLAGVSNQFLIDAFVFPGNSGGPVILQPENIAIQETKPQKTPYLIGVVAAYLPYQELRH